jgi:acyl-CoA reductase-like NAD-dependent aldehyde dehydrogenase
MTPFDYQAAAQDRNRRRRKLRDAAPDLLAALIELDAWAMNESGATYPEGTFEAVREAITKAIGAA